MNSLKELYILGHLFSMKAFFHSRELLSRQYHKVGVSSTFGHISDLLLNICIALHKGYSKHISRILCCKRMLIGSQLTFTIIVSWSATTSNILHVLSAAYMSVLMGFLLLTFVVLQHFWCCCGIFSISMTSS